MVSALAQSPGFLEVYISPNHVVIFFWFMAVSLGIVYSQRAERLDMTLLLPNKSPEPTAVGAGRSAVAVHAASRRWLSFFR